MMLDGLDRLKLVTTLDFPSNNITDESIEMLTKLMTVKVIKLLKC